MTPIHQDSLSQPTDLDALARTLWGEARGEDRIGREMVANCIMNRVNIDLGRDGKPDWWGEGVFEVCTRPYQFSCWNAFDTNRRQLMAVTDKAPIFRECLEIARLAIDAKLPDRTNGATHYANLELVKKQNGGRIPTWLLGRTPVARHLNHTFFRIV